MTPRTLRRVDHNVVVVGSGIAGLSAALAIGDATVLTNASLGGSSPMAQGGIAAAVGADDAPVEHFLDTLAVAAGLGDPEAAQRITADGPLAISELLGHGANFDGGPNIDELVLGLEAGHRRRRIVHANGDASGAEIMRALHAAVAQTPSITVVDDVELCELLCTTDGRVVGVLVQTDDGETVAHTARAVVLATGGYGHCYAKTTNPTQVVGGGLAAAIRQGATTVDMEFVQFHPTALDVTADPLPLLTEALRGEGAVLVNNHGERFMLAEHPDAELAPRDVVARANYRQIASGNAIYLDASEAVGDRFPDRFPTVFRLAQAHGLDPRTDLLPVSPAAHYCMGGIAADASGATSLEGLWAVGEVASTGLHGANRLASNSLLEGYVMGRRAAHELTEGAQWSADGLIVRSPHHVVSNPDDQAAIRDIMWRYAGVERNAKGLTEGLEVLAALGSHTSEALIAHNVLRAALARTESRGAHFRSDATSSEAQPQRSFVDHEPVPSQDHWLVADDALVATTIAQQVDAVLAFAPMVEATNGL